MPNEKPTDFLEKFADRDFADTNQVDVANVSKTADADKLLFGRQPAAGDPAEEGDDTFIWDESPEVVQKYGQPMWRTDVVVGDKTYRYWGKTRTEVTKALIKAQQNAVPTIEDLKKKVAEKTAARTAQPSPAAALTPDTRLPYDPIPRKSPRQITAADIVRWQELEQTDPLLAFREKMEATTGYDPASLAEIAVRQDNLNARRIADEAAFQFQANHAEIGDWDPSAGNTALIDAYLKERKWPVTVNNLEIAFRDLKAQNRLTMPPPEEEEIPAGAIPVVEEVPPPPPPVSVPASSARGNAVKSDADRLREDVALLQTAPLDGARELLANAFRKQRR